MPPVVGSSSGEDSSRSLRILLLTEDFYPKTSGGAFVDWEFARRAVERGHSVTAVAPRVDEAPSHERHEGVEIRRPFRGAPTSEHPNSLIGQLYRIRYLLLVTVWLCLRLRSNQYDVVYSTNHLAHPVAKVVTLLYGLPLVNFIGYTLTVDESRAGTFDRLYLFEQVIVRLFMSDRVLCRTPEVRDMVERVSNARASLIHGIVNEETLDSVDATSGESLRQELGVDPDERLLVFVGRLVWVKRPEAAVDIVADLPDRFRLLFVGDGEERETVEARIGERSVGDRVELLGRQPHERTLRIIAAADGLLLPSQVEAYPSVVFEALTLGTPVFATPVGVLPTISEPGLELDKQEKLADRIREYDFDSESRGGEPVAEYGLDRFVHETLAALQASAEDRP